MLFKLIARLFKLRKTGASLTEDRTSRLVKAAELMNAGDVKGAADAYREYLKSDDPYAIEALNNLGCCLVTLGDMQGAALVFEKLYILDDTFTPGVTNHAKILNDLRQIAQALPLLRQAKICDPNSAYIDAIFGNVCLSLGDSERAKELALRGWVGNFDDLRGANCHLVHNAYGEFDELQLAAEHRFWGETLKPIPSTFLPADTGIRRTTADMIAIEDLHANTVDHPKKIRIGYWSPDFRSHSVRYFFRPLLEGHDLDRFDIFLYHDFPKDDEQTALIAAACTQFHDICEFSDNDLHALVLSHQLDVFVELTGHMSFNRVALLQRRFATVQITGLGYPPTTGLRTVDAKILDRHIYTPDAARYYAEYPLVLPNSFWCFDPKEDVPLPAEVPAKSNGYVTFGTVGNLAKVTDKMLSCWSAVLSQVPGSRLLVRSITLIDSAAEEAARHRLRDAGISLERVDMRRPESGAAFFASYNEIDIILDTFPFNGGTTTCFATYMGVPVVSLYGDSLISRMGLSVLCNLGLPELAVSNTTDYVLRAVALAADLPFLERFRREARGKYTQSSLGNGKIFAAEFEGACVDLLERRAAGTFNYRHAIPLLPANEMVRRVFAVLLYGQKEAADRILGYCLEHYPDCGAAHNILAQQMSADGRAKDAADYLLSRIGRFTEKEQVGTLISAARILLNLGQKERAIDILERLQVKVVSDSFDQMQIRLFRAFCSQSHETTPNSVSVDLGEVMHIHILVPCDETTGFDGVTSQINSACWWPEGCTVSFERCSEAARIPAYESALKNTACDILVIVQKNIEIHNPMFFVEIARTLRNCDVVGFVGAKHWEYLDWQRDSFGAKAGSLIVESSELDGLFDIQVFGSHCDDMGANDAAILDGRLIAIKPSQMMDVKFDDELSEAGVLLEEYWLHTATQLKKRLSIHCNLGILINQNIPLNVKNIADVRGLISERLNFDPFNLAADGDLRVTLPVATPVEAVRIMNLFLNS